MPEAKAIGVARIKGQGVATTKTVRALIGSEDIIHATEERVNAISVNHKLYLSANLTKGAFSFSACFTNSIIC